MLRLALILVGTFAALAGGAFVQAAEPACLSPKERRAAVAAKEAVPLARAAASIRREVPGDLVRARLCRTSQGLIYQLTVLSRNGKVTRATIDAASGRFINQR